ncbi:MAG TPA: hypothetical protein VHC69_33110 [Polyangiaceae bacterium]|nr:hypothetical protein [Polyangiaceae bacterium]
MAQAVLSFPDMILVFFARLVDESFIALGAALTNRCQAMMARIPMLGSARSAMDACDRFARSRRKRALAGYPTRVLALREATCVAPAHI